MKAIKLLALAILVALVLADVRAADPVKGYQAKAKVSAPTRIDWTFAVSNQSVEKPPADWLGDYDSTKQTYELFVPPNYDAKKSYPVVLFVSPGNGPGGWKEWAVLNLRVLQLSGVWDAAYARMLATYDEPQVGGQERLAPPHATNAA